MTEYVCYLSLGANLGDKIHTLKRALSLLEASGKIHAAGISSMYETPPWGKTDQPAFVNCAAAVRTALQPIELLHVCQAVEEQLGRVRHEHWGARTIDIDLLHIPGMTVAGNELTLPHPYMLERAFVMVPLAEIAPELVLGNGLTAAECLAGLDDKDEIKKL